MKIRAVQKGDITDVRVLMVHPMETGQRKDTAGNIVPMHFIQEISVRLNGKSVLEGQISQAVSRKPGVLVPFEGRQGRRQDRDRLAGQQGRAQQPVRRGHRLSVMRRLAPAILLAAAAALAPLLPALAQDSKKEIERYQRMIADSSPAELYELAGEAAWKKPQGPNKVSLERCDLGLGAGVVKGAYAQLPRYFKDADRVMDLETRLLHCMTTLQGRSREEATKRVFGNEDAASEMENLAAYIVGESRGAPMAAGDAHTEGEGRPTSSARSSFSTAPAPGIFPAPAAMARRTSVSACRTCRC